MSRNFVLATNDTGRVAPKLRLFWSSTRTSLDGSPEAFDDDGNRVAVGICKTPGIIEVDFSKNPIAPNGSVRIMLPLKGEALNGTRVAWVNETEAEPAPSTKPSHPQSALYTLMRVPSDDPKNAECPSLRVCRQMLHRCTVIREMKNPVRGQQEFFYTLDLETHPLLRDYWSVAGAEAKERETAIAALQSVLRARIIARARWHQLPESARKSTTSDRDFANQRTDQAQLKIVSELMLDLIDQNSYFQQFPTFDGRAYQVGLAMDAFANGDLRIRGTTPSHGQPDSANLFCFAELAILCVDSNVEPERWRSLLRGFVRAQAIYTAAYGPPDGLPARYDDYGSWSKAPRQPLNEVRIAQIRGQYRDHEYHELIEETGRNCRRAFIPEE